MAVAIDSKADLKKAFDAVSKGDGNPPDILFLSDEGGKVINRYGLLNPGSRGLPHPATYVIDKDGIVRWLSVDVDYRRRPTNQQILDALKALP